MTKNSSSVFQGKIAYDSQLPPRMTSILVTPLHDDHDDAKNHFKFSSTGYNDSIATDKQRALVVLQ